MPRSLPVRFTPVSAALVLWVAQPFTTGTLLGAALDPTGTGFRTTVSVAAWIGWGVVLVAIAVPRPVTLTVSRIGVVGGLAAAAQAAVALANGEGSHTTTTVVGLVAAGLGVFSLHLPGIGDRFVDGVSYGDERRYLLRAPGPVLLVMLVPATAMGIAGFAAGPLLLADRRWVLGAIVTAIGWVVAWFPLNALHRLTDRFVVFVPNGIVVHDRTVLREPVLFVTREIAGLAPAPADTTATDITGQALGLALELRLGSPVDLPFVTGRTATEERTVRALLIAPGRPGAVMRTAVDRGIPVV